jgi:hypothetical protein
MLLIIDKNTKKVISNNGTNSRFPDGNIPNVELKDSEEALRIHDNSEIAQKIMTANKFDLVFDGETLVDINVLKTNERAVAEHAQSNEAKKEKINAELKELDIEIPRIVEDIIEQGKFNIHASKMENVNRKKELRRQLQLLL